MFFVLMGSVCALDVSDVSNTEDSNLTTDDAIALSQEKLEVSSEDSISETNLVNSHEDNIDNYPDDSVLNSNNGFYEDNGEQKSNLEDNGGEVITSANGDSLLGSSVGNVMLTTEEVSTINAAVKNKTTITGLKEVYLIPNKKYQYSVTLTSENGVPIKDGIVYFSYNGKSETATTDSNGIASIIVSFDKIGNYNVDYQFKGTDEFAASSSNGTFIIKSPETVFTASDLTMNYNDGSYFYVKFTDAKGNPLSKK